MDERETVVDVLIIFVSFLFVSNTKNIRSYERRNIGINEILLKKFDENPLNPVCFASKAV